MLDPQPAPAEACYSNIGYYSPLFFFFFSNVPQPAPAEAKEPRRAFRRQSTHAVSSLDGTTLTLARRGGGGYGRKPSAATRRTIVHSSTESSLNTRGGSGDDGGDSDDSDGGDGRGEQGGTGGKKNKSQRVARHPYLRGWPQGRQVRLDCYLWNDWKREHTKNGDAY